MSKYIYRNYTIEYLFDAQDVFSGYGDVSKPTQGHSDYIIFYQINPSLSPEEQINEIEDIKSKINFILHSGLTGRVIIFTLYRDTNRDWNIKTPELLNAIDSFNIQFLQEKSAQYGHVKILDINRFLQEQKLPIIEWRFFFTSQMPYNPKFSKAFKDWFYKQTHALDLKRKKCIVLDCDNTLWGGVVGEEGPFGIKLGMDYPGICFQSFQKLLLKLSEKGVILAVCSKNNLKDVQEVWDKNPNHLINSNVLSAYRINWQDKASNIKSIAEELNIGTDSFVFIDDNPVERGLVKEFLPEVAVPDFPDKPYELVNFFWQVYHDYFMAYEFSAEDMKKTEQYKQNFFRNESKKAFDDMDDYLSSLGMEIDIIQANESNISRIAQMTQKTNQFNLTTRRYTQEQLQYMLSQGASIYCAHVKDKFGDNGITIAAIITEKEQCLHLDSYLLSCRILGRGIEKTVLLALIDKIKKEKQLSNITAEFIPTKKNAMATNFLEKVGFTLIETTTDGVKKYRLEHSEKLQMKDYYKITFK
ncbi:HAD-IIIC family phosphatase [Riemerella anatipestifer]|uniref:HAD-IIIC family phosphatase n=1 Tax=Riemerella anatipestifer TaxID=34085 RepID=UPI002EA23B33|nr:HAD-IIIC family phosphatase [Riemerella anatipestifer]